METAGNRCTVGSVVADIRRVHRQEGIRRGWLQEGRMVVARGNREPALVNLGGGAERKA